MRRRKWFVRPLLVLFVLTAGWVILTEWVFPPRLFRKAVLNPIPASVRGIKGSGFLQADACHTYVLRFKISPEDVPLILASDQFKEIECVEYRLGILSYAESYSQGHSYVRYRSDGTISSSQEAHSGVGGSFMLFEGWRGWFIPRWFQPAKWQAFKAYAVNREEEAVDFYDTRFLLHNADTGEAYFINRHVRGNWAWSLF